MLVQVGVDRILLGTDRRGEPFGLLGIDPEFSIAASVWAEELLGLFRLLVLHPRPMDGVECLGPQPFQLGRLGCWPPSRCGWERGREGVLLLAGRLLVADGPDAAVPAGASSRSLSWSCWRTAEGICFARLIAGQE